MRTLVFLCLSVTALAFSACSKDSSNGDPASAMVKMTFHHTLRGVPLKIGTYQAINDSEQVKVDRIKYYLSNFRIKSPAGKAWAEEESYHLIYADANGIGKTVIKSLPSGEYSNMEFYFGVDSAHNNSIDYSGDLDPSFGMAWDWVTGYKFFLMEGKAKNALREQALVWHIGSNENFRKMNRTFPTTTIKDGDTLRVSFTCALDSLFLKPNNFLPLATHHNAMDNRDSATLVANNFAAAFIKVKP